MTRLVTTLLLALGLSGCYVSEMPLIPADKAVFPFEKITFKEVSNTAKPSTLVHKGLAYIPEDTSEQVTIRFMPVADGLYLVETSGEQNGKTMYLHALLKVDTGTGKAESFAAIAGDANRTDVSGLRACPEKQICIDSLDAYIAYAKDALASGGKPDMVYTFTGTP